MAEAVKRFFIEKEGSALLAWRRRFGASEEANLGKVPYDVFEAALVEMQFVGNISEIVEMIDHEKHGYITLDNIDQISDDLWISFTRWCASTFTSVEDLQTRFSIQQHKARHTDIASELQSSVTRINASRLSRGSIPGFTKELFMANAARLGWFGAHEPLLFAAIDEKSSGHVTAGDVSWFARERQKELKRASMKKRSKRGSVWAMRGKVHSQQSLQAFIVFLKNKYGCLFRAWRSVIDRDGDMSVERKELYQACKVLGWNGDMTSLWKALDADDSGTTSLDELASSVARPLALFKKWADQKFGNFRAMFRAFDSVDNAKFRPGHLDIDEWAEACEHFEFPNDAEVIFKLLDWNRHDFLVMRDVVCLDKWQPQEYLMADANPKARDDLWRLFLKKYKHTLIAWRNVIDKDGCGRVSWSEFQQAAAQVRFTGDVAGAWLALDHDNSGHITLAEMDHDVADSLSQFRRWAQHEYGSALIAFEEILRAAELEEILTSKHFRKQLHAHGYKGDAHALFKCLDTDGSGNLSRSEVAFLDEWELADMEEHAAVEALEEHSAEDHLGETEPHKRQSTGTRSSQAEILAKTKVFQPLPGNRLLQLVGWLSEGKSKFGGTSQLSSKMLGCSAAGPTSITPTSCGKAAWEVPPPKQAVPPKQKQKIQWRMPKKVPKRGAYAGGLAYTKIQKPGPIASRFVSSLDSRSVSPECDWSNLFDSVGDCNWR